MRKRYFLDECNGPKLAVTSSPSPAGSHLSPHLTPTLGIIFCEILVNRNYKSPLWFGPSSASCGGTRIIIIIIIIIHSCGIDECWVKDLRVNIHLELKKNVKNYWSERNFILSQKLDCTYLDKS